MRSGLESPGNAALNPRLSIGFAIALAGVVLLPLLGHKALTNWDEAIYAEVSREMLRSGWLVPHWNGQVWLEKPPLMLWITAAFFKLFGVTEFWARAGSAFSGIAIVGILHGWVARRYGLVAAWVGTVALLTTTGFLHVCRVGEMDVLLSLGCVVALTGLSAVAAERPRGWFAVWVGFAVAAMTKGGASIVIPLTAVALAVVERWRWHRFGREFWLGMVAFAGLVVPWHLAMWLRYGAAFAREYFGYHVLARAAGAIEGHETPWWFYGRVLFVSAMPWILLLPFALRRGWLGVELRVWVVFALVVIGFFTVVRTRLPHYVAPVYPATAVLTAVLVADWLKTFLSVRRTTLLCAASSAAVLLVSVTSVTLTRKARAELHRARDTGGSSVAEDKESVRLLQEFFSNSPMLRDPVLVWRRGHSSIAASIFYSGHQVQQVQLTLQDANGVRDKYTDDPLLLRDGVRQGRYLLLLEVQTVQQIPSALRYQEIARGTTMELGWIERR